MSGKILREVRAEISKVGFSEHDLATKMVSMQRMFERIQELKEEMNEAKKLASQEAAKPYIELIEQIEMKYAFELKLRAK